MKHFEEKYGFKVGQKIRRKNHKKYKCNNHPIETIVGYMHSGIDTVILKNAKGKETSMNALGLEKYEKYKE